MIIKMSFWWKQILWVFRENSIQGASSDSIRVQGKLNFPKKIVSSLNNTLNLPSWPFNFMIKWPIRVLECVEHFSSSNRLNQLENQMKRVAHRTVTVAINRNLRFECVLRVCESSYKQRNKRTNRAKSTKMWGHAIPSRNFPPNPLESSKSDFDWPRFL